MTAATTRTTPTPSPEAIEQILDRTADAYGQQARSPLMHRPSEAGLAYEEVYFLALDGVPIEGWYIPAPGSDRLIIANHPRGFSRSGMPAHLAPWNAAWSSSGNDWEVDLVPDYKILHDAGYNVLTYDLRNHGHSGAANGGMSSGLFESRDVLGSLRYARERADTRDMTVGLFSRCLGCNSTLNAIHRDPGAFRDVRCLLGCQPLTPKVIAERLLALQGVPAERIDDLEQRMFLRTSIDFAARDPRPWCAAVEMPTMLYQVHDDVLTVPDDVQGMFDALPVEDKELLWIKDSTLRWDGYVEFQRRPKPMLDFLDRHMS